MHQSKIYLANLVKVLRVSILQQGSLPLFQHERVFILLLEEIVKVVVNNFTEHMDRVRQLLEAKVLAGNLELYHQERSLHIVQVNNKSPFIFKLVLCTIFS